MEISTGFLLELGAILLALTVLGSAARRYGLSPIPLYLLAGLFLGNGGIAPVHDAAGFISTGASIGVVGTITGFLVGTLICVNIESIRRFLSWMTNTELFSPELYFLSKLPADMDVGETAAVVIMALTLSLLATLYPSWRAARLDPVEALRYE